MLAGGIIGVLSGFALTIGTSLTWPHVVGGKPIISITPYIIIAFELMILFGALSGVAGFLFFGRFPRLESIRRLFAAFQRRPLRVWSSAALNDRHARVEMLLKDAGAEEIERESAYSAKCVVALGAALCGLPADRARVMPPPSPGVSTCSAASRCSRWRSRRA